MLPAPIVHARLAPGEVRVRRREQHVLGAEPRGAVEDAPVLGPALRRRDVDLVVVHAPTHEDLHRPGRRDEEGTHQPRERLHLGLVHPRRGIRWTELPFRQHPRGKDAPGEPVGGQQPAIRRERAVSHRPVQLRLVAGREGVAGPLEVQKRILHHGQQSTPTGEAQRAPVIAGSQVGATAPGDVHVANGVP